MILSLLLTQIVPVSLPDMDLARVCDGQTACIERESGALNRLETSWNNFPASTRFECARKAEAGEISRYSRLEACLIIEQVTRAQTAEPGNTHARIDLRPVSARGQAHAD